MVPASHHPIKKFHEFEAESLPSFHMLPMHRMKSIYLEAEGWQYCDICGGRCWDWIDHSDRDHNLVPSQEPFAAHRMESR